MPVRADMERVSDLIAGRLGSVAQPLRSALLELLSGGKRLRAALVLLVGQALEGPTARFRTLAAGVEILHTATLIHDDLIDGAPLRRGRRTLHAAWPTHAAVLAGDCLLGQATLLIAQLDEPRIMRAFGQVLCTMCSGEITRALEANRASTRRQVYYQAIEAKTASLFAATTEMAGIVAGASDPQVTALRRFGRDLGMAFQIVDDVLDLKGESAEMGKCPGSDLQQGLVTLPTLYYLEQAGSDDVVRRVLSGQGNSADARRAMTAIRASGSIEASLAEARGFVRRSQQALQALPPGADCQVLHALAGWVVERSSLQQ